MVFLALRGWTAIGFDYLEKLKVRAVDLAKRAGVAIGKGIEVVFANVSTNIGHRAFRI